MLIVPSVTVVTTKSVIRHCQMSPGEGGAGKGFGKEGTRWLLVENHCVKKMKKYSARSPTSPKFSPTSH